MSADSPVVGVLGHFADANHGDDACPIALLHHLRERMPRARFVLFCRFADIARARYGLPAYPVRELPPDQTGPWQPSTTVAAPNEGEPTLSSSGWRARARTVPALRTAVRAARLFVKGFRALPRETRFLWRSYRRLRGVDLLLVTGSNPLFDFFGGFWEFPYTIWKWSVLAGLTRTPLAFVSVGAGPIVSARSGRLLARALHRATYVSFRDHGSETLMRRFGFRGVGTVLPDLAHSLPAAESRPRAGASRRVGINPMIVHHGTFWPVSDRNVHRNYVESLAAFAVGLLRDGYDVFFYGTQKDDLISAGEICAAMREGHAVAQVPEFTLPETVDALVQLCASADVLVTTRFHGAVFGMLTTRPTLAICYQGKTREVLEDAGFPQFAFDFEDISAALLRSSFDELWSQREEVESRLQDHAVVVRARLQDQYEDLLRMLQGPRRRPSFERTRERPSAAAVTP